MLDTKPPMRRFSADNPLYRSKGLQLADDAALLEEGVIDSLGVMELVVFVEDQFGVQEADEEVTPEYFDSVNRLACYVESKLA